MAHTETPGVGDKIGDHWTVVAVITPKSFFVDCSCGVRRFHTLSQLHRMGRPKEKCGHGVNA